MMKPTTEQDNAEHLKVVLALTNAHQAATSETRCAAATSIRQLVIRNEELTAGIEGRPEPEWLAKVREALLPQFRVHLETVSGPWPQTTETVFMGSASKDRRELFIEAFARLKASKYPDAELAQWRMLDAIEDDHFAR